VVTGGSAVMQGMVELGEEVFHMPVRLGVPRYLGGLAGVVSSPRYSTGVGLLLTGLEQHRHNELVKMQNGSFQHVFERMKSWVTGNF
jgi:cell division protein FtsA